MHLILQKILPDIDLPKIILMETLQKVFYLAYVIIFMRLTKNVLLNCGKIEFIINFFEMREKVYYKSH